MPACEGPATVVFDRSLTEYDFGPSHPMSPLRVWTALNDGQV